MTDRVRMKSKTVFANERVTVFSAAYPEGKKGEPVTDGDEIETDLAHAKDLDRLGLAIALNPADLEGDGGPLEPHYTVSVPDLQRDQAARAASDSSAALGGNMELGSSESTGGTGAEDTEQRDEPTDDVAIQPASSRRAKARKEA